jgi:N-acetyltransferase
MNELPRFEPRLDPRPKDAAWPEISWPVDPTTVLIGEHVTLTVTNVDDAPGLFTALDFDSVWAHVRNRPSDVAGMQQLLERGLADPNWCRWSVRTNAALGQFTAGALIGSSSYLETSVIDARTEIGFTVYTPEAWATAVNPETKLLLLTYAFEELDFGRVQLKTDIRNVRSQQAIARLGAQYEGVLRRYQRRTDGSIRDTVLFSITVEDWPSVKARLSARLDSLRDLITD